MAEIELTETQQTLLRGDNFSPIVHVYGRMVDFNNPRATGNMEVLVKTQPYKRLERIEDVTVRSRVGKTTTQAWRLAICVQKGRFFQGRFNMNEDGTSEATEVAYADVPEWVWEEIEDMSEEGWNIYLRCDKMSIEDLKKKGPPPITDPDVDIVNSEKVKSALMQLDHKNPDHWTRDGKPNINVLRRMTRMELTKADLTPFDKELTQRKIVRVKLPGAA